MGRYNGIYSTLIDQYISFKRNLGYKFIDAMYTYSLFDRFTIGNNEIKIGITKDLSDKWAVKRPNESDSTRYKRIFYLAQFSSFLNEIGYPSYVPKLPKINKSTFTPYIFSEKEIEAIFQSCDQLKTNGNMDSCINVIPALFRVLYSTGIRISEAISLKNDDVNLVGKYFVIKESKNGQERMIPLSNSLVHILKQYRNSLPETHVSKDYFFVKRNGRKCSSKVVYEWFRKVIWNAGIMHGGRGHGPGLHSFRHTFSVHSLAAMARSGLDLYYCLPILSTYLGHQSLEATDKYVRLTSDMYPSIFSDVNSICAYVFPEVNTNETY